MTRPVSFRRQLALVAKGLKRGFTYDGCTGVPDFNFGNDCCNAHDYDYQSQRVTRARADAKLRACIVKKGEPEVALVYWIGVRLFAWPVWYSRKMRMTKSKRFPLVVPAKKPDIAFNNEGKLG